MQRNKCPFCTASGLNSSGTEEFEIKNLVSEGFGFGREDAETQEPKVKTILKVEKVEEKGKQLGGAQSTVGSRHVRTLANAGCLVDNIFLAGAKHWGRWQASGQLQHPPHQAQRPGQPGHLHPAADHLPDLFNMCLL